MRIAAAAYPREPNWWEWVVFEKGEGISLVFAQRLAAYAKNVLKRKLNVYVGYRSTEEQQRLYNLYLAGQGNPAAKPGTSWHEYRCAVDVSSVQTNYPEIYADYKLAPSYQKMKEYGICLPLWMGATIKECWHIQPYETIGYTGDRSLFLQADDQIVEDAMKRGDNGEAVKSWQAALSELGYSLVVDGSFGPATENATKAFQTAVGLSASGVVGDMTFCKALDLLRASAAQRKVELASAMDARSALEVSVGNLNSQLSQLSGEKLLSDTQAAQYRAKIRNYLAAVEDLTV